MSRTILIIGYFLLQGCFSAFAGSSQVSAEEACIDSVLQSYGGATDSVTFRDIKNAVYRYSRNRYTYKLTQRLFEICKANPTPSRVSLAHFMSMKYNLVQENMDSAQVYLDKLLLLAKDSRNFYYYFEGYRQLLNKYITSGNYEYALAKAKVMAEESVEYGYPEGCSISNMTIANAYRYLRDYDKAIYYLELVVNDENAKPQTLYSAYQLLSVVYLSTENYEKALTVLDRFQQMVSQAPKYQVVIHNSTYLNMSLQYAQAYLSLNNLEMARKYLDNSTKYLAGSVIPEYTQNYHRRWALYYQLKCDWVNALYHINLVLENPVNQYIPLEISDMVRKSEILLAMGDSIEGLALMDYCVVKRDSLNASFYDKQRTAIRANYEMEYQMMVAQENLNKMRSIQIFGVVLIFLVIIYILYRLLKINVTLKKNQRETQVAYQRAERSNQLKELFVKNISYEIRGPLSSVVGFSQLLMSERDLDREEVAQYSEIIRKSSQQLITLVNNVLELSRLDAQMMSFNDEKADLVKLIQGSIDALKQNPDCCSEYEFTTEVQSLSYQIDAFKFSEIVSSVLYQPEWAGVGHSVNIRLKLDKVVRQIIIRINNTPLSDDSSQEFQMRNDINKKLIAHYGGSYTFVEVSGSRNLIITLNL